MTQRSFSCRCGRPVFFRNSHCLGCKTPLGYEPLMGELLPLAAVTRAPQIVPGPSAPALWRCAGAQPDSAPRYWRCSNLDTAAACNWLMAENDTPAGAVPLCRCCRLTRTLPDLSVPEHRLWWGRIELGKRRLVSSLIGLRLPVLSKTEDALRGWVFDLLNSVPGQPPVVTGHADGVITLDAAEADDACRDQRRHLLGDVNRTLLGHLRHESGHYYWQRLVKQTAWLEPVREVFGDERQDYAAGLNRHYHQGAPAEWGNRFVSAHASSHAREDWAETWAHYLHLVDTLATARDFSLDGECVELQYERFGPGVLGSDDAQATRFLRLINSWMELTGVLNELSRSMGVADFYPFVLSAHTVRKLYLVHRVIAASAP